MKLNQIATISAGHPYRGKIPEIDSGSMAVVQMRDASPEGGVDWSACLRSEPTSKKEPDWLQTGDILYIPPGFPHDGYAITEAMSYSIGYRAPNQQDLFSSFADFLLQEDAGQTRYTDPQRQLTTEPGLVTEQDVNDLRTLMQSLMQDEQLFSKWLGTTLSQAKHELNILPPQEWDLIPDELIPALEAEDELYRLGGLRCLYFP